MTTYDTDRAIMNSASGSPFGGMKVIPLTRNVQPAKRSTIDAFVLDPFPGDTPQNFVVHDAYVGADGLVHVEGVAITFEMGSPAVTVIIYGYGLTNAAGTVWNGGQLLDQSISLQFPGDGATVEPDLAYGF